MHHCKLTTNMDMSSLVDKIMRDSYKEKFGHNNPEDDKKIKTKILKNRFSLVKMSFDKNFGEILI